MTIGRRVAYSLRHCRRWLSNVATTRRSFAADLLQVLRRLTIGTNQGCSRRSLNVGISIGFNRGV
jgi:hypothetical protein